jgi:hypothetical protein
MAQFTRLSDIWGSKKNSRVNDNISVVINQDNDDNEKKAQAKKTVAKKAPAKKTVAKKAPVKRTKPAKESNTKAKAQPATQRTKRPKKYRVAKPARPKSNIGKSLKSSVEHRKRRTKATNRGFSAVRTAYQSGFTAPSGARLGDLCDREVSAQELEQINNLNRNLRVLEDESGFRARAYCGSKKYPITLRKFSVSCTAPKTCQSDIGKCSTDDLKPSSFTARQQEKFFGEIGLTTQDFINRSPEYIRATVKKARKEAEEQLQKLQEAKELSRQARKAERKSQVKPKAERKAKAPKAERKAKAPKVERKANMTTSPSPITMRTVEQNTATSANDYSKLSLDEIKSLLPAKPELRSELQPIYQQKMTAFVSSKIAGA